RVLSPAADADGGSSPLQARAAYDRPFPLPLRSSDVGSIGSMKVFHVVADFGGRLQRAANKVAAPPQRRPV
ncbi:unnamed protein product, partial [Urochloa humidicola]